MAIKIYTKTGDGGETSLFGGARIAKDSPLIDAYGTVDELNSILGMALAEEVPEKIRTLLGTIQSDLFVIGSDLATPVKAGEKLRVPRLRQAAVERLEQAIDSVQEQLPELRSFIVPGGRRSAAELHFARAVCRRAERLVVGIARIEKITPSVVPYLNRLSDLLFVMARYVNHDSDFPETRWPGK